MYAAHDNDPKKKNKEALIKWENFNCSYGEAVFVKVFKYQSGRTQCSSSDFSVTVTSSNGSLQENMYITLGPLFITTVFTQSRNLSRKFKQMEESQRSSSSRASLGMARVLYVCNSFTWPL